VAPDGEWDGWKSLAGEPAGDPVLARNADGHLEAFYLGYDSAVWHTWQEPDGMWKPGRMSLGGAIAGF
jgi:hypothetical protein